MLIYYTGEQCSSYEALKLAELKKGSCQQIVNGTADHWLKIKCLLPYNRAYRYQYFRQCRSTWCHYFASCLDQRSEWKNLCSLKFYWFHASPFDITTAAGGINGSYFRNIRVKSCGTRLHDWNYFVKILAIKVTEFECKSRSIEKGV